MDDLNPRARSLDFLYGPEKDRHETYEEIVRHVVGETLAGADVCLVAYGHPGVFAGPSHEAIKRVRAAGLPARMLPAVSALDCLCADLGIDPGRNGLLVYEATSFLDSRPAVDPRATLVLFQVGMLGEPGGEPTGAVRERFPHLVELLRQRYGADRAVVLYEASAYPGVPPTLVHFSLDSDEPPIPSVLASLCVP